MLRLGSKNVSKLFLGGRAIANAYLGDRLVWQASQPLPYDAEVEYLESTGTQWIDTVIHASQNTTAKTRCAWMTVANDNPVFGADNGSTWNGSFILMKNQGIRFIKGGPTNVFAQYRWISPVAGQMYDIECRTDGIVEDGMYGAFNGTPTAEFYTNKTIPLFAWWRQTSPWPTKCRIAYVAFYENGFIVRDFIPVRFTNDSNQSEGAMYDRVSGALFRNAGTGAFVIGPDVQ